MQLSNPKRNAERVAHRAAKRGNQGQRPKFAVERTHKPKAAIKPTWPGSKDQRAQSRPVHVLHPNREPDASKRQKPKSAAAKSMDRPERVAMVERGHAKLMRFFGAAQVLSRNLK